MTDPTPLFYLVFALAALIIGMGKGGFGSAFAALATPLLALLLPVPVLAPLMLPFLMLGDLFAVGFHWRRWDRRQVLLLIPGALVGVAIGTLFLTRVSPQALRTFLAILVLLFALYRALEPRVVRFFHYQPRPWHGLIGGSISGFSSAIANTGGPPATLYLLMQDLQPRAFIATSALFFMILNIIKVPFYLSAGLFDRQLILSLAWLLPLVPVGVWLGRMFVVRVSPRAFESVILLFLVFSALLLLLA